MNHSISNFARGCFVFLVAAVSGCAYLSSTALEIFQDPQPKAAMSAPTTYQRGVRQLEQEDFKGAIATFDEFLQEQSTSAYTQVAIFNTGRAYEGLSQWAQAEEKFRAVARATNKAPKLQALALYRLSFCYEAQNDDPRTVASLIDVRNRAGQLPEEIAAAEMPARLAAAYARVGNIDEAMKFYAQAEVGISRLKNRAGSQGVPEWLPRTLYFMGRMSLRQIAWDGFESTMRPVSRAQLYLLQAAELETGKWSDEATVELIRLYSDIWQVVKTPKLAEGEEPLLAKRQAQERQWELVELVISSLRELRAARAPIEKDQSPHVEKIFEFVGGMEKKLLAVMDEPLEGGGPTAEARERRERVRGRVVKPDPSLEEDYERQKAATEKKAKAKTKKSKTAPKDPNL